VTNVWKIHDLSKKLKAKYTQQLHNQLNLKKRDNEQIIRETLINTFAN